MMTMGRRKERMSRRRSSKQGKHVRLSWPVQDACDDPGFMESVKMDVSCDME